MNRAHLSWVERDGIPLLVDPVAEAAGIGVVFSARLGGVSPQPFASLNLSTMVGDDHSNVTANRTALSSAAGFVEGSLAFGRQVHGANVMEVSGGAREPVGDCDALVATDGAATLGVLTADCVPVLLMGSDRYAAVHAGWRGLVAGVIEAACARVGTVEQAWVGPSIRACCYQVGPEVVAAFHDRGLPVAARDRVDPGAAAASVLGPLGAGRVAAATECTSCDSRFFSHRRDGKTGRQGAFIGTLDARR